VIRIEKGRYDVWPGFSLKIPELINFLPENVYQLVGPNGSGKSSFIHKLLLPQARDTKEIYLLCIQQQLHLQLYAMKALAAIYRPGLRMRNEEDLWSYLWEDLALQEDSHPVCVIADEAHSLVLPPDLRRPSCVIYSSHRYHLENTCQLHFEPISATESEIHV